MDKSWKQKLNKDTEMNGIYEPNGANIIIEESILKKKNIPSSQHLMLPSPKLNT